MSKPDPLSQRRRQLQTRLELHPEIRFAYLHGSAPEGLPYHDLDVALYLEPTHPAAHDPFDYAAEDAAIEGVQGEPGG